MIEMEARGVPMDAQPEVDGASLTSVRDRLCAEFPFVPADHVDSLLTEFFGRTRGARVQTFRVLLADRDARAALRSYSSLSSAVVTSARSESLEDARAD